MSFVIIDNTLIKGNLNLPGNALKVYSVIYSFLPKSYPSIKKICELTGLCRNTVLKWKSYLEDKGIVQIHRTIGRVNLYTIAKQYLTKKVRDSQEAFRTRALEAREKAKHFRVKQKLVLPPPPNQYQKEEHYLEQLYVSREESKFNASEIIKMLSAGAKSI